MRSSFLFDNFNKYARITESDFEQIEKVMSKRFVKKRRTLLTAGDVSRYIYFIEKGALRSFTIDKEGTEHVIQLALEDHWIADLYSFVTQVPGNVNIEAIEDSEVLLLPHHELDLLYDQVPALERYFRHLFQRAYVGLQQRLNTTVSLNAEDRYRMLIHDFPQVAARVPLIYVASFLGITPESLSRIRKQLFH
ncbi:Crp/Fnr family transcriptional regulator [Mucilaginibacter sp. FT3.2]|uniref:Crp/Fnr family transcriptional regulator n=1 Tax=Mucilaginibacter sp. FT3.2 TaxID=2723090 RepID=UPI00161A1177|nr:Crp/Fnr family transcriptional regulator [Mucilaginibacter sp. FT3.2]MBB6233676.1 CRP-like cAMP-binding protein [Mucilaginibacter sp. FT3.2]